MNKEGYLNERVVSEFTEWLGELVNGNKRFEHSYEMEVKGRRLDKPFIHFESLYDAYLKYSWGFSYYDFELDKKVSGKAWSENAKVLNYFSRKLRLAVSEKDDEGCYKVCEMILDWGGVLGNNRRNLEGLKEDLSEYLRGCKELFESSDVTLRPKYVIMIAGREVRVKMNAGFTKIYALLCDSFIIYDGRVGAALGLLVKSYCIDKGLSTVPEEIAFYYGKAKNKNVNRNPSDNNYKFKCLHTSDAVHIRNNLKANWIIGKVLSSGGGNFSHLNEPERCFESALFMIGYRV